LGLLANVLLAPVMAPVAGLRFVLNALREQVESESVDVEKSLQEELRALNMRLEIGEIGEEEFEAKEAKVLEKLRASRSEAAASNPSATEQAPEHRVARDTSPAR
jgi:hypothetical protein